MKKSISINKRFLKIPVWTGKTEKKKHKQFFIRYENKIIYEFKLAYEDKNKYGYPDYYAFINIEEYIGKSLDIEVSDEMAQTFFENLSQADKESFPYVKQRPRLHYSAPYGWINDPNGLIYIDGEYHLYYQHNPMNNEWGNMSWGHAVSRDFINFEYVSDVMYPDEFGAIFSGCAVLNERALLGLPNTAVLFFYTAAAGETSMSKDKKFTQRLAYSLDKGKTLIKYEDFELPCIEDENRDPKIFWHEATFSYIMSLYLSENRFAILRSEDLKNWELTQTLSLEPMWECPDLFELSAKNGEKKWVFMSADGYYFIGEFDGYKFQKESEMKKLYETNLPYAAQSFSNLKNRVVSLAWLRTGENNKKYKGLMSLPREFSLGKDEQGYFVKQNFIKEANPYLIKKGNDIIISDAYIKESVSIDGKIYTAQEI